MNSPANAVHVTPLKWTGDALLLLDQRLLPREVVWVECRDAASVAEAIRTMVVRGAPAIGVSAAYGIALAAMRGDDINAAATLLKAARPTAVNLAWAVDRMTANGQRLTANESIEEAQRIHEEDLQGNRRLGRYGAELLGQNSTILTHCNAGALATAGYGT
ncbi:MAG TPA: S-methyl-5-thioribose-1-phosphate isomerase, partial [Thermoanaerobaculia bacterium]|nr:S-methyl-5-thioribose-1-phosphate isomerase [Thermoanaerobaculia bacterium]